MYIRYNDVNRLVEGHIMQLKKLNRKKLNRNNRKKESDKGQLVFKNIIGDYFVSSKEGLDRLAKIRKEIR